MKVFVYAFHKTGSMFLYRYFKELARLSNLSYYSINNQPQNQEGWKTAQMGFIVCPIRPKDNVVFEVGSATHTIIHVRNPIDVLISQYFSYGWTHVHVPTAKFEEKRNKIRQQTLDGYCLNEVKNLSLKYMELMQQYDTIPNKVISSYSGMHNDFKRWNRYICTSLNQNNLETSLRTAFKSEFNWWNRLIKPLFIRGQHRRDGRDNQMYKYLKPETITQIENEMESVLKFFNTLEQEYDQKA